MKRLLWLGLALSLAGALFGQQFKLGSKVTDFAIFDLKGNPVEVSTLKGDITVLMFIATKCPISNDYNERMNAVYNDYASKGVKFVAINPNRSEPAAEVAEHAASNGFPFKVYKDNDNVVADRFGAQVTPEVFVLDKASTIRYHGYIDNSRNPANIKVKGLRMALDAMLAGNSVARAETKAFGCTIKRVRKAS
jgi:peroxiredoxin